ncbi:MAG TPA: hypothetical protein ENH11_09545 [Candidatus Acetothermia bacterium]|nr:hypothetical protein [Candidatus Acetothermia bacterium]
MSKYASGTSVSVEKSKGEIERILLRYGADQYMAGSDVAAGKAMVSFRYKDIPCRVMLKLPALGEERFHVTPGGRRRRDDHTAHREWEKACRQQWRVLRLLIHAQLEAVDNGVLSAQDAFFSWIILPNGSTVSENYGPELLRALGSGQMPKQLTFGGEHD